jgi:hypothetical protein
MQEKLLGPLPALVDNVSRVPGKPDSFWVGLVARPSKLVISAPFKSRVLRWMIAYLPEKLRDKAAGKVAGGIQVSGDGSVERVIADPAGEHLFSTPSGVLLETNGKVNLYMGSLENGYIAHAKLN